MIAYFRKALREAKAHTSWSEPNAAYEEAELGFAEQLLSTTNPFFAEFKAFHQKIDFFGKLNSLSRNNSFQQQIHSLPNSKPFTKKSIFSAN
jgi:(1->4)-alpha-D-glucan 1-alpha-D-glucosylmutase